MILSNKDTLFAFLILLLVIFLYILHVIILVIYTDKSRFNKRINVKKYINDIDYKKYSNLIKKDYNFKTSNNNQLNGNIYYYKEQYENIIIFACGYNMSKEQYLPEINFLSSLGYTVFCYDNLGTGSSEGKTLKGIPQSIIDLEYCINNIKNLYPNSKITLVGHSMGAYACVNVLNTKNVDKVIAISPFNNILDVVCENIRKKFGRNIFLYKTIYNILLRIRFKKYASYNTFDTIKYINTNVLIIHGEEDKTVNVNKCIDSMISNNNSFIKFLILPNKGHEPLLSINAINYNLYLKHQISDLKLNYGKNIPETEIKKINENVNIELKTQLDEDVLKEIKSFIKGE